MIRQMQIGCVLAITAVFGSSLAADSSPQPLALNRDTVVRFATMRQGRQILRRQDRFVKSLGRFDIESRVGKIGATQEDFLHFVSDQARPWSDDLQQKVSDALRTIRRKLQTIHLPLPPEIVLVHTTGKEEAGAAYCRQNAIVLPRGMVVRRPETSLERLLIHELFHIASSHHPAWRDRLFELIGFHPCEQVPLPASLVDRKITNPDAPSREHYIQLEADGRMVKAVPLLVASVDRFDPVKGGSFFRYLQFRLMVVEAADGRWTPVIREGRSVLIDPKSNVSFHRQIGGNTKYIIHPEEILADNFVHLVLGTTGLENPELVESFRQRLLE
jgi:hypothetical protein